MASHRKKRTPKLFHTGRNAHLNKFSTSSCWPPQETVAKHLWLLPMSQAACASPPPPRTNPQRTWAAAVSHHTHCCRRRNCCWLFCTTPLSQAFVQPHTAASFLGLSPVSRFLSPPPTHTQTHLGSCCLPPRSLQMQPPPLPPQLPDPDWLLLLLACRQPSRCCCCWRG